MDEQVPVGSQRSIWLAPLSIVGYAVVVVLLAALLIKLFPSHTVPIALAGFVLFFGLPSLGAGLAWHSDQASDDLRKGVRLLGLVFVGGFVVRALGKCIRYGWSPESEPSVSLAALVVSSVAAGFGIGWLVSKRRAQRTTSEETGN